MWINIFISGFFVLLTAYFFVLPLSKKRPVLIRSKGLVLYTLLLIGLLYMYVWASVPAALFLLLTVIFFACNSWLVCGVTEEQIFGALEKAASATRSSLDKDQKVYTVCDSVQIHVLTLFKRINLIFFRQKNISKKAKITKVVMKKFIQNYYI